MMTDPNFIMVSILCQTYNHGSYIAQCLHSLVSQIVNFRYEILVHDDASTDGTDDVIRQFEREYPLLIKPIYQTTNQWSIGNKVFSGIQLPRCTGRYIAVCEGDDYWIDPLKLQKQVDFLEKNQKYYLVGMRNYIYNQNRSKTLVDKSSLFVNSTFKVTDYINQILCHTSTLCLRREFLYDPKLKDIMQGDVSFVLHSSNQGNSLIKILKDFGSVYRIHSGGITQSAKHRNVIKAIESLEKIYRSYDAYSCYKDHKVIENKVEREWNVMLFRKEGLRSLKSMRFIISIGKAIWRKCTQVIRQQLLYNWVILFRLFRK